MTATPKPRAGEHISAPTRAVVVLEALAANRGKSFRTNRKSSDAEEALFELRQWLFQVGERKEAVAELTAERDLLKAQNAELVEIINRFSGLPNPQWQKEASALLAKHGR
jgi:hypothetical protein